MNAEERVRYLAELTSYEASPEERTRPEAMTESTFKYDITARPTSAWNRSAARVFAPIVIRNNNLPVTFDMRDKVEHAFSSHLERIFRRRQDAEKDQEYRDRQASRARRQTRRNSVSCPV